MFTAYTFHEALTKAYDAMSGLARKLIICAAVDGLIIQPLSSKGQRSPQPIRVRYGDGSISNVSRDQLPDTAELGTSFEAFGVIGKLDNCQDLALGSNVTVCGRHD